MFLEGSNIEMEVLIVYNYLMSEKKRPPYSPLDAMMALLNKPDAIVASADKLTTNCIRYFKSKNIRVPEDIALIGFSNLDIADLLLPSLSVVRQPAFAMGQIATELLLKMIESKRAVSDFENRVLPLEIMVRESSSALK